MRLQHCRPGHLRLNRGFTLVEIMIVVTIIGLLAALAVPVWAKARRNTENTAFINDLRSGLYAAQTCLFETGAWPAEVGPGIIPPEMAPYSKSSYWLNRSPIGGNWDWDYVASPVSARLTINGVTVDDAQMAEIDLKVDDGDLSTGRFQKLASGKFTYILE